MQIGHIIELGTTEHLDSLRNITQNIDITSTE
jgi:hypothetical protein